MVVNARKLLRQIDIGDDVLLSVSVLRGMSFMDWKRGRELFNVAYGQISGMLAHAPGEFDTHAARLERLRGLATALDVEFDEPPSEKAAFQPRRSTITDPTE